MYYECCQRGYHLPLGGCQQAEGKGERPQTTWRRTIAGTKLNEMVVTWGEAQTIAKDKTQCPIELFTLGISFGVIQGYLTLLHTIDAAQFLDDFTFEVSSFV